MKTCTCCHADLALDAFSPDRTKRDGRASACRACRAADRRRQYNEDDYARARKLARQRAAYHARPLPPKPYPVGRSERADAP